MSDSIFEYTIAILTYIGIIVISSIPVYVWIHSKSIVGTTLLSILSACYCINYLRHLLFREWYEEDPDDSWVIWG